MKIDLLEVKWRYMVYPILNPNITLLPLESGIGPGGAWFETKKFWVVVSLQELAPVVNVTT